MKKNIWRAVQIPVVAALVSSAAIGCASNTATREELAQLESINTEIQSLEQRKAVLQKEHDALAEAIRNKESQLSDMKQRKNRVGQTH